MGDDSHAEVPDPETIISLSGEGGISTLLRFGTLGSRRFKSFLKAITCAVVLLDGLWTSWWRVLEGCRNEPAHAMSHLSLVGDVNLFTIEIGIA